MAEPRRLQFTTVQAPNKTHARNKPIRTVRLKLTLTKPDHDTSSEYSYTELVRNTNNTSERTDGEAAINGPGDAEDRKLQEVARAFELKYGSTKKKKKDRIQDLVDLGDGYDESDTFIDNSEAYDEIVPDTLTTKHGGFYINSGDLEFREITDSETGDTSIGGVSIGGVRKKRVRRIKSDSDSENDFIQKNGRKKKVKDVLEKSRKRLIKKQSRDSNDKFHKPKLTKKKKVRVSIGEIPARPPPPVPTRDEVPLTNTPPTIEQPTLTVPEPTKDDSSSQPDDKHDTVSPQCAPPLPPGLPATLMATIAHMKQAAKQSQEGKCKFFTEEVNKMLLAIDTLLARLKHGERSVIYSHLAAYLPCNKDTLTKRVKKLRLAHHDLSIAQLIGKLKLAVESDMKKCQDENACVFTPYNKDTSSHAVESGAGNLGESKGSGDEGKLDAVDVSNKFVWTAPTRELLCEVVGVYMVKGELLKLRVPPPDEYLGMFLASQIVPLWPAGYMTSRILYQESLKAHVPYTSNPKKNPVGRSGLTSNPITNGVNIDNQGIPIDKKGPNDATTLIQKMVQQVTNSAENLISSTNKKTAAENKTVSTAVPQAESIIYENVYNTTIKQMAAENKSASMAVPQVDSIIPENPNHKNVYDIVKTSVRKESVVTSPAKHSTGERISPLKNLGTLDVALGSTKLSNQTQGKKPIMNSKKRATDISDIGPGPKREPKVSKKSSGLSDKDAELPATHFAEFRKFSDSTANKSDGAGEKEKDSSISYLAHFQKFSNSLAKAPPPFGFGDPEANFLLQQQQQINVQNKSKLGVELQQRHASFTPPKTSLFDAAKTNTQVMQKEASKKQPKLPKPAAVGYAEPSLLDSKKVKNIFKDLDFLGDVCALESNPVAKPSLIFDAAIATTNANQAKSVKVATNTATAPLMNQKISRVSKPASTSIAHPNASSVPGEGHAVSAHSPKLTAPVKPKQISSRSLSVSSSADHNKGVTVKSHYDEILKKQLIHGFSPATYPVPRHPTFTPPWDIHYVDSHMSAASSHSLLSSANVDAKSHLSSALGHPFSVANVAQIQHINPGQRNASVVGIPRAHLNRSPTTHPKSPTHSVVTCSPQPAHSQPPLLTYQDASRKSPHS